MYTVTVKHSGIWFGLVLNLNDRWHVVTERTSVCSQDPRSGPIFMELLSTNNFLAWNFFLHKNRITNQISVYCILLVSCIQLLFAYPENHVEIWLVIMFLLRKKFYAKQIFVLSSSMKLGPGCKNQNQLLSFLEYDCISGGNNPWKKCSKYFEH